MNKKFWYLTKVSLNKKIKSKWFIVTNIILLIAIVSLINIESIIKIFGGDFDNIKNILVVDNIDSYEYFKSNIELLDTDKLIKVEKSNKNKDELIKEIEDNIIVILNSDKDNYLISEVISKDKIDNVTYQIITNSLNNTKTTRGLILSNIDPSILENISTPTKVDRVILNDSNSQDENTKLIMNSVFPTLILPFFMLVIFLVQMVGGEICEEKTTRSMEVIIANISPKYHLLSKVVASNVFVLIQGLLLFIFSLIGLFIHKLISGNSIFSDLSNIVSSLNLESIIKPILILIPSALILMILSFIAYAVISGILASLTVNIEDFNQLQTPIVLISLVGYYLAITASMFEGSTLIHILSYIPFLSAFLSPTLYIIGEISIWEVLISIIIMIIFIYFLFKKGMKIYKNGILNYSTDKVWNRFMSTIKSKE